MIITVFVNHLINASITASILIILILAAKRAFGNRVNAGWHYYIWFVLVMRLVVPYISTDGPDIDHMLIFLVWMAGAAVMVLYSVIYNICFWSKVKDGKTFTEQGIIELLENCKERMGVSVSVSIIKTSGIGIPAVFGVTRPWLLMPEKILASLDQKKLKYVILHELAHLKRKDILLNWFFYLLEIIYWFNPFVWLAFHRMRADRELACDETVLARLDRNGARMYGHTILDMAELISSGVGYAGIAGLAESRSQIADRISMISRFGERSRKASVVSIIVTILLSGSMLVNAGDYISALQMPDAADIHARGNLDAKAGEETVAQAEEKEDAQAEERTDMQAKEGPDNKAAEGKDTQARNVTGSQAAEGADVQAEGGTDIKAGETPDIQAEEGAESSRKIESAGLRITDGISITADPSGYYSVYIDDGKLPDELPDTIYMSIVCADANTDEDIIYMASHQRKIRSINWVYEGETRKYYRFRESDHPYALIFLYDTDWDYLGYYLYQLLEK